MAININGPSGVHAFRADLRDGIERGRGNLEKKLQKVENDQRSLKKELDAGKALMGAYANRRSFIANFSSQLKKISGDKPLRMKSSDDGKIRLKQEAYRGLNPFKLLGFSSSRYQAEANKLKEEFDISTDKTLDRHLLGETLKKCDGELLFKTKNLRGELDQLEQKEDGLLASKLSLQRNIENLNRGVETLSAGRAQSSHAANLPIDIKDFFTVYSTNEGAAAINRSLRNGSEPGLSKSAVINELKRLHGDDLFSRGNKKAESDIKFAAGEMTLTNIRAMDKHIYASGLANPKLATGYRGVTMTEGGLRQLADFLRRDVHVSPDGLFSCSSSRQVASAFADKNVHENPVIIEVSGRTQHRMTSALTAKGESESLFSTRAIFKITGISRVEIDGKTYHQVKLSEVINSKQSLPKEKFPR
jgi:hypothetical protein